MIGATPAEPNHRANSQDAAGGSWSPIGKGAGWWSRYGPSRWLDKIHTDRALLLGGVVTLAVLVATNEPFRRFLDALFRAASELIGSHPRAGPIIFVLLSAASAMVMFFSSAVLVPVAIYTWGRIGAFLLLWLGWFAGGVIAYWTGRIFGRRLIRWVVPTARLREYENRVSSTTAFVTILLFYLAAPSEIPGYLLGAVCYPFRKFMLALALVELPFAAITVYLGTSLIERNIWAVVSIAVCAFLSLAIALRVFRLVVDHQAVTFRKVIGRA